MKILFSIEKIEEKLSSLNISHSSIQLTNEQLKQIINLKENMEYFELDTKNLFNNILQFLKVNKCELLIIYVQDKKMIEYFQYTYKLDYIHNIESAIYKSLNPIQQKQYESERYDIVSDNENDINIIEKFTGITIDNIYCISLKERIEKRKIILQQCTMLGLPVEFIIVNKNKENPTKGCLTSHILCIEDARNNGYENILILEDDVVFNINIIRTLLQDKIQINIPTDFDMLYLGYNVNNGYRYDNHLLKLISAQCGHAYIVNERLYDYILDNINNDWTQYPEWKIRNQLEQQQNFNTNAIDLFYAKIIHHRRGKSYGIFPMICIQQDGFSDIENKQVSYTQTLLQKSIIMYSRLKHHLPTYFINLEKRQDRLQKFKQQYNMIIPNINIFKAIDGSEFDFKPVLPLFNLQGFPNGIKNPYHSHQWKAGVLGCSLSHYLIWEKLAKNQQMKQEDYILVLEDDIELCDDFILKINNLLDTLHVDNEWDVTFLGFTDYKNTNDKKINEQLIQFSGDKRIHGGGTFAYIIRRRGAIKLFKIAQQKKIQQAIDWFMIEQFDTVISYKCEPELVFSTVQNNKNNSDSDIQNRNTQIKAVKELQLQKKQQKQKLETIIEEQENLTDEELEENQLNENSLEEELNDNDYKEIKIKNKIFFKNSYHHLFNIVNGELNYHGQIINNKLVIENVSRHMFNHNIQLQNINKPFILFYIGSSLTYHIRKIYEALSLKYNVIVFGDNVYNIKINGVYYIYNHKEQLLNRVIESFKIKKVFITNFNYFLYTDKKENQRIYYIHDKIDLFPSYKMKNYKNNGVDFINNYIYLIDELFFFSEDEMEDFKAFYNIELDNISLNCLSLSKINKIEISRKQKFIVCYDKHPTQVLQFFKIFNEIHKNTYKLVLFNDDFEMKDDNIICLPRNEYNLMDLLNQSLIFVTFETMNYTYHNIITAIQNNCLCLIPKYYSEFNNKCITYSKIDDNIMKELLSYTTNKNNLKTLNKMNNDIIKKHLNNNKWLNL
jgi:GR25 family glycosyltransferase involved in LPS biosynthesis